MPQDPTGPTEVDPEALRASMSGWDNRLQAAMLGAAVLAATLYPVLLEFLVARLGPQVVGVVLALVALLATALAAAARRRGAPVAPVVVQGGVALLALLALLEAGDAGGNGLLPLLLVPGWIYAGLAWAFLASLRDGRGDSSLVERTIRQLQPVAPDFIGPYCRKVTVLWGLVLGVNAIVLTALALTAPVETWKAAAGKGLWLWMGGVSLVEFLVRKTYFRNYYYRGPFERVWERLFPAGNTEMGRRSAAYIRLVREQQENMTERGTGPSPPP